MIYMENKYAQYMLFCITIYITIYCLTTTYNHVLLTTAAPSSCKQNISAKCDECDMEELTKPKNGEIKLIRQIKPKTERKTFYSGSNYLQQQRLFNVNKQRKILEEEMKTVEHLNGNLNDLIMEKGGEPIRSIVFATYRSGSTFVGDIINQHPGTYYHYEPLYDYGPIQIRSNQTAQKALTTVKYLLNCRYDKLPDVVQSFKTRVGHHNRNSRLAKYCLAKNKVCWDSQFLSTMCKLFPYQSMKIVRLRLKFAKTLLDDEKLKTKIMLLIRDPRAILQSRKHVHWCKKFDCLNPSTLCSDMVDDYFAAEMLYKMYPNRFMALRYEDISRNPFSATRKLYNFFGLHYSKQIEDFVFKHTTAQDDSIKHPYSTYRNSLNTLEHWKEDFANNFTAVKKIQRVCSKAMKLWGYLPVLQEAELKTFNSFAIPPWEDMVVSNDTLKTF